jgi:hypothetical protein
MCCGVLCVESCDAFKFTAKGTWRRQRQVVDRLRALKSHYMAHVSTGFGVCSRCAVLCCAVLCCAVLCCAVLCCAVLCCAVLCCAVLCDAPAAVLEGVAPRQRGYGEPAAPVALLSRCGRQVYVASQQASKGFLMVYDLASKQLLDLIKVRGGGAKCASWSMP